MPLRSLAPRDVIYTKISINLEISEIRKRGTIAVLVIAILFFSYRPLFRRRLVSSLLGSFDFADSSIFLAAFLYIEFRYGILPSLQKARTRSGRIDRRRGESPLQSPPPFSSFPLSPSLSLFLSLLFLFSSLTPLSHSSISPSFLE